MSTRVTVKYTIKILKNSLEASEYFTFFAEVARATSKMYGDIYNWQRFDLGRYLWTGRLAVCERDGKPVGVMLSQISGSIFDPDVKILRQHLLYARPGTRAAHYLMKDYIDFGKANANHIITMIARNTNIKGSTLEKLGFKKIEEFYRIEVK